VASHPSPVALYPLMSVLCILWILLLNILFGEQDSLSFVVFSCLCFVFFLRSMVSSFAVSSLLSAIVFILFLVVCTFLSTSSLLVFFVMYEFSLYPVCTLILLFGYQPEKLKSTYYLILYTVVCSAPLLFFTIITNGSLVTGLATLPPLARTLVCLSFMVKAPLYTLHS